MKVTLKIVSVVLLCAAASACRQGDSGHVHHQHAMPHDFSDANYWSTVFDDPKRDKLQMPYHVVEIMKITPGMAVVDLGAGTGYFMSHLSKATGENGTVAALEIEQSLVDHMNKRAEKQGLGNVKARVVAPNDPALDPQSVDRILIVNTWHHLPDRVSYAKKLATALSADGMLFIVDITMESEKGPHKSHRILPETIIETLEKAGLKAIVEKETLPDQYIVSAQIP